MEYLLHVLGLMNSLIWNCTTISDDEFIDQEKVETKIIIIHGYIISHVSAGILVLVCWNLVCKCLNLLGFCVSRRSSGCAYVDFQAAIVCTDELCFGVIHNYPYRNAKSTDKKNKI